MRGIICTWLFCLMLLPLYSVAQQPFEKYGYEVEISTLSDGKYIEDFTSDSLVQIGSIVMNRVTGKIVSFITYDTVYSEATLDPQLISRWMSPDPLAHEYYSHSPYNFVMNNPILYVDPDGTSVWIPGTDGEAVSYQVDGDGNVVWSENATEDTKKIGNALLQTETGTQQLDALIDSDTKIRLQLSDELTISKTENGTKIRYGETNFENSSVTQNADGSFTAGEATITIFERTIEVVVGQSKELSGKAGEKQKMGVEGAIGSVAAHESVHATDAQNINMNLSRQLKGTNVSKKQIEVKPNKVEKKYTNEYLQKNGN